MIRCMTILALIACVVMVDRPAEAIDLDERAYGGGPFWECTATGFTCLTCHPLTPQGSYNCIMPWVQCDCQPIGIEVDMCHPVPKSLDCGVRIFYQDNGCTISASSDQCPPKDHCFGTGNCPN